MSTDADPYKLLGVSLEATEKQITTAYRKLSVKLHPDKNPDDPNAADRFHELNQAYQKLLDPIQRLSIDAEIHKKREREIRYAKFDNKRKQMQAELEQREEAYKKKSRQDVFEKRKREQEIEKIKEEGRKMREQAVAEAEAALAASKAADEPEIQPESTENKHDTTIRLKYTLASHPTLDSTFNLVTHLKENRFTNFDEKSIVLLVKPAKKKKNKESGNPIMNVTAVVSFKTIGDAFAIVCASGNDKRGLKGIQATWASGTEPAVVAQLKNHMVNTKEKQNDHSKFFSFSTSAPQSTVPGLDFESATLMRLRQAERERLEREIKEQEALEES